jgi:uncharacterized protein (DUF362 family)
MIKTNIFTRRDFLRTTAAAAAAASAVTPLPGAPRTQSSSVIVLRDAKAMIDETRVDAAAVRKMLDQVLLRMTGEKSVKAAWLSLLKPTDIVGLVPTPHLNPTHRELVAAVIESLKDAGIPAGNIRDVQGSAESVEAATALISLPGLKAHWLTGIGTVLKNYIMFSGNPEGYHHANSAKLGEIWNLPRVKGKTKLVLVDALRPLCDKGPQPDPRYMWPYKGLIAGQDPVAVESVCLKIITEKRRALRGEPWPLSPPPLCVKAADEQYGVGVSDLSRIRIDAIGLTEEMLL